MRIKLSKDLPLGLSLLRTFYIINAILLVVTLTIYSTYLEFHIFKKNISGFFENILKLFLIGIPIYVALGFTYLKKNSVYLAIIYHIFFIINGTSTTIGLITESDIWKYPLLEIIIKPQYKTKNIFELLGPSLQIYFIHIIGVILGIFIVVYLIYLLKNYKKLFT